MAHLVAVYKEGEEDYKFLARQIPLIVDDSLKMVLEFSDNVMDFENHKINMSHWKQFYENYSKLKKQDLDISLMVTSIEVHSSLSQLLPCVGCRQSVERLFSDIVESGNPALDPLIVEYIDMHSVNKACLLDARELYTLLYIHGSKLNDVISAIPKSKKNKRCQLHSLDTHKSKPFGGSWMDVWELMSQECRDEVVLIESESLSKTIEIYLRKHRFCSECKNKVMRAYDILVGDLDKSEEKEYCPALYEGLSCCPQENHIHVCCETDFIAHLLFRAEPEFVGGYEHKERHAKTIDIAQEEVLTCLGIHLSERLHMIWQKLQAEVQTWQILFHLGVDTIRRRFEMAVEKMQGISRLEQFVEELSEVERAKVLKQEKKREKRKNWRKKKRGVNMSEEEAEDKENDLNEIYVESIGGSFEVCGSHDEKTGCDESIIANEGTSFTCSHNTKQGLSPHSNRSDCGYSSSMEGSEMWSRESSDVACSEGICNHDEAGDEANDHHCAGDEDEIDSYVDWWPQSDANNQCKSKKKKRKAKSSCNKQGQTDEALTTCHGSQSLHPCQTKGIFACGDTSANPALRLPCMVDAKNVGPHGCHQKAYVSLLELQDDSEVTTDAEAFLTQNEIQEFLERNQSFYKQRHHYRVLLKERFDGYCRATKQSCPFLEEWFASTTSVN